MAATVKRKVDMVQEAISNLGLNCTLGQCNKWVQSHYKTRIDDSTFYGARKVMRAVKDNGTLPAARVNELVKSNAANLVKVGRRQKHLLICSL